MHIRFWTLLAVVLLGACAGRAPGPAAGHQALQAPMAGRVGIMSLMQNKLVHVHAGTGGFGDFKTTYPVRYDFNGFVREQLRKELVAKTPYQPIPVQPTGLLMKHANKWQKTNRDGGFAPKIQREIDGIMKQNRLAMLIIASTPEIDDGVPGTGQSLVGSGLYTRTFLGNTSTAVFSTLRFHRLVGEPARLVHPVSHPTDRHIGDLPDVELPDQLKGMSPRYLAPVYTPLHHIIRNKIKGLISLPRKLGH